MARRVKLIPRPGAPSGYILRTGHKSGVRYHGKQAWSWYASRDLFMTPPGDLRSDGTLNRNSIRNQGFTWQGGIRARGPTVAVRNTRLRQAIRSIERTFGPNSVTVQRAGDAQGGTERHALFHVLPTIRPLHLTT